MDDEKKPEEPKVTPPAGEVPPTPPAPNQPTSEELQKKIKELEDAQKEKDAKLAEAQTTLATIEARKKEVEIQKLRESADANTQARIKRITENFSVDPDSAGAELAQLLKETKESAAIEAAERAVAASRGQSFVEKLKSDIKASNPEFDDDLVQDVLDKANAFAQSGKFKNPEECVKAASDYVKQKLEKYATTKYASPKVPAGAKAEGGGSNNLTPPPPPPKEISFLEELEAHNEAKARKAL